MEGDEGGHVYVIDDDSDLAASLARLLRRRGFIVQNFDDPAVFLAEIRRADPCCIITDVMMGDIGGFDLARRAKAICQSAAIIFMTAWPRITDAVDAVRDLGGIDYLEKPLHQERLIEAVGKGLDWSRGRVDIERRISALSAREREVFDLVVRGRSSKMIAAQLNLAIKTIEDHRAAIMRKTQAGSLAELIDLRL